MHCVNCGKPYDPDYKFCNYCGYALPSSGAKEGDAAPAQPMIAGDAPAAVAEAPAISGTEPPPFPGPPTLAVESAPYAPFVSFTLGSVLLLSVLVFNVAQAIVRNRLEYSIVNVMAALGGARLARSALVAWRRVVAAEPEMDATLKRRHQRVLRNGVIISLLFFTSAAMIGGAIGKSRDEAVQLAADLERVKTVGSLITKARTGVEATIASYVEMYKGIAPDVKDLESTLSRLKTELGIYDSKFPAQHEQTSKSIAGMETGLRRMTLLKQQIEVAKQIEALDSSEQVPAWRTQMLPLLAEEDALTKAK